MCDNFSQCTAANHSLIATSKTGRAGLVHNWHLCQDAVIISMIDMAHALRVIMIVMSKLQDIQ